MRLEKRASFGWPATEAGTAPCANGMVAHYDSNDQGLAEKDHSACRAYWKWCRNFHMNTRGWLDIGYSFAACPHGVVMEGRGWGHVQAAQPGGNTTWTSCTFMTGPSERPTDAQLHAWSELRAWLRGKGLAAAVKGHRDFNSTDCPGGILYAMVRNGTLRLGPPPPARPTPGTAPPFGGRLITQPPVMHGDDVLRWQRQMHARGWSIAVDGNYGPASEKVCRAFQAEKHLGVDGIVGERTWAAAWTAPVT
jgi:hypothetical protein